MMGRPPKAVLQPCASMHAFLTIFGAQRHAIFPTGVEFVMQAKSSISLKNNKIARALCMTQGLTVQFLVSSTSGSYV